MATLISGPFQPFLEEQFIDRLSKIKGKDPFLPVTIIAPTGTILKKLTMLMTESPSNGGEAAWVNVHFFTTYTFSENILRTLGVNLPGPTTKAALRHHLMELLKMEAGEDRSIAPLLRYDSYIDRLIRLFSRLTSYKVSKDAGFKGIERTILSLYHRFNDEKRGRGLLDREDIIRLASEKIGEGGENPLLKNVFLYGFYDLNPIQRDIVSTINEMGNLVIFSPVTGDEPFAKYAGPTVDFFHTLTESEEGETTHDEDDADNIFSALSNRLFEGDGYAIDIGGTDEGARKGRIRVVTAPGDTGEAKSTALEILRIREESPETNWGDICVTMRDLPVRREKLRSVFERYSIPACFAGGTPLKGRIEVTTFLNLLSLFTAKPKRVDISTLLISDRFSWPGVPGEEVEWVRDNSHLVETIARDAGIVSGARGWREAWRGGGPDLFVEEYIDDYIDDGDTSRRSREERRKEMERFRSLTEETITGLIDDITGIPDSSTPEDYSETAMGLLQKYILPNGDDPKPYETLKSIISSMAGLTGTDPGPDESRVNISLTDFISLLDREISEFGIPANTDADAVFVSSIMGTRGLSFKTTIVVGLNEKKFPRIFHSDPLVSERTREKLGMPTARSRFEEEKLLFAMAVRSAGEKLVLTYQRSDESGRKAIYSTFLRELLLKIETDGVSWHEIYEEGGELPEGFAVHYPRLFQSVGEHSMYTEKDLRISTALRSDSLSPDDVRGVVSTSDFLREGLVSIDARSINKPFSIHDGIIGKRDGILDGLLPMSAGKLETYAECPFRFFMKYVIDVDITEEPAEDEDMDAREIGTLYHRVLARLFGRLKEKSLLPLTEESLPEAMKQLERIIGEEFRGGAAGRIPRLVLRARSELIEETLTRLIAREFEPAAEPGEMRFIPELFEASFGYKVHKGRDRTEPHPPLVVRLNDRDIPFSGRIDRIDVDEGGGTFRVVDYKKKKPSRFNKLPRQIDDGIHFQIPIYLMAAKESIFSNRLNPYDGRLVFIEYEEENERIYMIEGDLEPLFNKIKDSASQCITSIEGGIFYPKTSDFCRFCSYKDICRYVTKGINKTRVERTERER